ncbi:MAG TPA: dTMP kinase [Mycobacteriales bacterium]
MAELATAQLPEPEELRGVLSYASFRRLWIALTMSSFGDWLGLLATTALGAELAGGDDSARKASFAIGGVLIFRLLPAVILGPFAGAFADRFDRRKTMVVCDLMRFVLFASIPLVREIPWLLAASFLVEAVSLFWIPAKEASVPNLLPPAKLEGANQVSLITTYGTAPLAAAVFAGLAKIADALGAGIVFFKTNPVDLALYFDAATFLFSAMTVYRLREIRGARRVAEVDDEQVESHGMFRDIVEGWRFIHSTPLIRGLVVGMLGAFAAGGTAIALGRLFVGILGGGDAAYGLLFGAIFTGLAVGMALGPRLLENLSRHRLFGISIVAAGASLSVMSLLPNLILALFMTVSVGAFAGIAWIVGYTLLGLEVEDEKRGRTFATVQSLVRVDLLVVLALAPVIAGVIGPHRVGVFRVFVRADGVTITLFVAGVLAVLVGLVSYRQMDDGDVPLWRELARSIPWLHRRRPLLPGVLIAFEGGEGAGKSTQARLLAEWLRELRDDVVVTFEPGATDAGRTIREVLLSRDSHGLSPRAEAMLYAADRAQHVATVVRPALERGAVVVTDRFVDSSLAYQGGGRELSLEEVRELSRWATNGVRPDVTVLLDLDPAEGLARAGADPDRMESESLEFHERVRATFRALAHHHGGRYVVVDAAQPVEVVAARVREEVERRLGSLLVADPARREVAASR